MSDPDRGGHGAPQRAIEAPRPPARATGLPTRALGVASPTTRATRALGVTPAASGSSVARRRWVDARSFGASAGWTLLSAVVPGLGLVRTRWRPFGLVLAFLAAAVAVIALLGSLGILGNVAGRIVLLTGATNPQSLTVGWVALAAFGVLWLVSIVATHLLTRPTRPTGWQRVGGAALVGVLALAVAVPTFVGARTIYDTASLIRDVFQDADDPGGVEAPQFGNALDPWANKPRLNVLILGSDAGPDRKGTRTDTVIVASVNTRTGDTVLYSLPRQTQKMPFPQGSELNKLYPRGFVLPDPDPLSYAVSAMYAAVPEHSLKAIPPAKDPGAKALELSVGEALGLQVDYYAMVNLEGFTELVNALGGITVNINKPVPVGGKNPTVIGGNDGFPPDRWLAPGPHQHLNGYDALWYARGRYQTNDYDRMSRQRCVIQAITQQVNLANVLANYEALTKAGKNIVATDVPNSLLPALIDLASKVRSVPLRSISFENDKDGFSTENPNWRLVRERVQESLDPVTAPSVAPTTDAAASPSSTPSTTPRGVPSRTPTASKSTSKAAPSAPASPSGLQTLPDGTRSVADECAYDPTAWQPQSSRR